MPKQNRIVYSIMCTCIMWSYVESTWLFEMTEDNDDMFISVLSVNNNECFSTPLKRKFLNIKSPQKSLDI